MYFDDRFSCRTVIIMMSLFLEPLADFKAALKRSISKRQESVTSGGGRSDFQHQISTVSQLSQEDVFLSTPGLSDHLSRLSMEDLPIVASPSPFPGRSAFPGPAEILDDKDDEDDLDAEVSDSFSRACWPSTKVT